LQSIVCILNIHVITAKGTHEWLGNRGPHGDWPCLPTAAEPFSPSRRDPARSSVCDRHMAIQGRLDVMEETVEKTVEHLEAEVKGLLGLLEELAWNLPPGPFSLAPDLLGDGEW
uniref:Placenta associated 9 n=1 Tax=Loxodonta africana TaxID=9785 RepID=G3SZJ4_LOXAF